jgi:hypothetical protein
MLKRARHRKLPTISTGKNNLRASTGEWSPGRREAAAAAAGDEEEGPAPEAVAYKQNTLF